MLGDEADDAALVSASAPRSAAARPESLSFDEFVRRQYSGLVGFVRNRTGARQDAEDVAQESFAKLLRYRDSEPAHAWPMLLYRIAINVVHDQFRLARTHHAAEHVDLETQPVASPCRSPEENALHDQQAELVTKAILGLPPKCKRVYLLIRVQGLSHRQVADICGISVKMVEKHLATALVAIKRKVGNPVTGTSRQS